jgi:hypothetical protein
VSALWFNSKLKSVVVSVTGVTVLESVTEVEPMFGSHLRYLIEIDVTHGVITKAASKALIVNFIWY